MLVSGIQQSDSVYIYIYIYIYIYSDSFLFFFLAAKNFIVSIWSKAWERAPGWLEICLVAAERVSRQKP